MNCELCGTNLAPDTTVCPVCGARVDGTAEPKPVRENMALGIVGALIGALLGGASILLFSKLGYVASLSGVLIAFATLGGYRLLAKGMGKAGLVICIVLMLIVPFLANALDLVLTLHEELSMYGMTMGDTASFLVELIGSDQEVLMAYLKDLGMLYLFVVIGAVGIVKNALKGN